MKMNSKRKNNMSGSLQYIKKHYALYLMLALPIAYYVIFCYLPMGGILISFEDYNLKKGVLGSDWVGLENFARLFQTSKFWRAFRNTLVLNVWTLVVGFPAPIILALMLNELRSSGIKKSIQTIVYLPHFLSWVIIGGMVIQIFATENGIVNGLLNSIGIQSVPFLRESAAWIGTYVGIDIWQSVGWGAIIYLSVIICVDQGQYDAATVDGCNRFRMMYKITLPNIMPTIIIMLILRVGGMVSIGFDKPYMLGNSMVKDVSEVLSTYSYEIGMVKGNFSLGTAIGLFQSVLNFTLVMSANKISKKITGSAMW